MRFFRTLFFFAQTSVTALGTFIRPTTAALAAIPTTATTAVSAARTTTPTNDFCNSHRRTHARAPRAALSFVSVLLLIMLFASCATAKNTNTARPASDSGSLAIDSAATDTEFHTITAAEGTESTPNSAQMPVPPVTDKSLKTKASVSDDFVSNTQPVSFGEVWGYLIAGEEDRLDKNAVLTDIGYFGAGLNTFGKLVGVPNRKKLDTKARVHLVVADNGAALTHFCLDPEFRMRGELIDALIEAAKPYDGLQIDFELVNAADKEHYLSFLAELKKGIGNRTLSVAIPARTRKLTTDAYDYERINQIVDRAIIMAYDEHWSGSKPGPVASLDWCANVANYAASVFPLKKLVMGLPFYGRAWSNDDTAGAYRFSSVDRLFRGEYNKGKLPADTVITEPIIEKGIPKFTLSKNVTFTFYFDNARSLYNRLHMYRRANIRSVAFWRIGQEDPDIWKLMALE